MSLLPARCRAAAVALPVTVVGAVAALAEEGCHWPRFHGPDLTNRSPARGLLKAWPEGGPPLVWRAEGIGNGYSSVAGAGGLVTTTGNIDGATAITAFTPDGRVAWRASNGPAE